MLELLNWFIRSTLEPLVSCVHPRLRVGVVQHHRVGVLQQAGRLLVAGLVKALLIERMPRLRAARSARSFSRLGSVCEVSLTSAR